MKKTLVILFVAGVLAACKSTDSNKSDYQYKDVPFTNVHFSDDFWAPRIETIRSVTVPFAFHKCEETHRIDNFAVAGKLMEGKFNSPYPFDDSDVYKIMEGAAYLLAVKEDKALDMYMDSLIHLIGAAQEPDGYLYTTRTIGGDSQHPWAGSKRWENERDNSHELYNVGHMYEAAVAHYLATGKRSFLDIAIKSADLLCNTFGPEEEKITVAPGHQEVEIGLVKLYRVTGDKRYLDLSQFFLEARGKYDKYDRNSEDQFRNGSYWQDHKPVIAQDEAVGHAVRATYMYAAMTDIAALKNERHFENAVGKLWDNVVGKKMYITGAIGSTRHGEAFGKNYELPNSTAYCDVVPLVFSSIAGAVANMKSRRRAGKIMGVTVATFVITGAIAAVIMFLLIQVFPPVLTPWTELQAEEMGEYATISDMIVNFFTASDFVGLLSRRAMLPLIVFSILFGFAVNLNGGSETLVAKFLDDLTNVMLKFVKIVTYYAPIAFFAIFADLVASYGPQITEAYGRALLLYYPLCFVYIFTAFPLFAWFGGGKG